MKVKRTVIQWHLQEYSREAYRRAVLEKWADEACGTGKDELAQRYRYDVETFENGVIYLHRPAFKNKGCDFTVHCEPLIPRDDGKQIKTPRHIDLIRELVGLSNFIRVDKDFILQSVEKVYQCESMSDVLRSSQQLIPQEIFCRYERALKVAKWLFIEQDITVWNTSGRAMLMNAINKTLKDK